MAQTQTAKKTGFLNTPTFMLMVLTVVVGFIALSSPDVSMGEWWIILGAMTFTVVVLLVGEWLYPHTN